MGGLKTQGATEFMWEKKLMNSEKIQKHATARSTRICTVLITDESHMAAVTPTLLGLRILSVQSAMIRESMARSRVFSF